MNCTATRLPYRQTQAFSRIVLDYIDQSPALKPFFDAAPTQQGIRQAIAARMKFPNNRTLLVEALEQQYAGVETGEKVRANIRSLLSEQCFTVTTAHQNNIFTGPLYFIYKILHTIRLADQLNELYPEQHFVPVFYIGSEDADLDELNHTWVGNDRLTWETRQTGAVGRMKIDKALTALIGRMEGQLLVQPHGEEIIRMLREYYREGRSIAEATFLFVNHLFMDFGLLVLQPDQPSLKSLMHSLFEDELLHQKASGIVEQTTAELEAAGYKVQAHPREINLFYLNGDRRDRISVRNGQWTVLNGGPQFSREEILQELKDHPGRFSPNVILRGLYQETILPNIAFIGGGGETAYWLQLKDLFVHYRVPFPVLVLRNSFLIIEKKFRELAVKLGLSPEDIFAPEQDLLNKLVLLETANKTRLNGSMETADQLYALIKDQAAAVDATLAGHVEALHKAAVHRLAELEKKMLRAERRKFSDQQRQIRSLKENLFPGGGLQERRNNLAQYYALWGNTFLRKLYEASSALEHEFVVLTEL